MPQSYRRGGRSRRPIIEFSADKARHWMASKEESPARRIVATIRIAGGRFSSSPRKSLAKSPVHREPARRRINTVS